MLCFCVVVEIDISIHAPTRGATKCKHYRCLPKYISIHAPTRGATGPTSQVREGKDDFNPRSHEGSDGFVTVPIVDAINFNPRSHEGSDELLEIRSISDDISIHAPTRGATIYPRHRGMDCLFQSTLPRGERRLYDLDMVTEQLFQSTLPRGERQQFSPKSSLFSQQKLSKIFNLNNKLF